VAQPPLPAGIAGPCPPPPLPRARHPHAARLKL
jgi:hypothetical protein